MTAESYMAGLRRKIGNDLVIAPGVAAIIHDSAGRLLLQEKASGEGWSLPAGAIELGETPQTAVIREVLEETGWDVVVDGIIGVFGGNKFRYTYPSGDQVEYVIVMFKCSIVGGDGRPTDAETRSLRYFARNEMPSLALPYPEDALFPSC
jgi:8-oxo-dGTP pyrophosphatase MutT (NUDIX family)